MEQEICVPLQVSTSVSDDTNTDQNHISNSYSSDDAAALSRDEEERTEMCAKASETPSSAPSEVTKVSDSAEAENTSRRNSPTLSITNTPNYKEMIRDIPLQKTSCAEVLDEKSNVEDPVIYHHDNENETTSVSTDEDSTSNFLSNNNSLQWTEKKTSRVGQEYQALIIPEAGSYLNPYFDDFDQLEQLLLPDQIWDPLKATCKGINDLVHLQCPSNKKESALELLHQKDYDGASFEEDLDGLHVFDGSDWSLIEHENFRKLMQSSRHNVKSVSKSMGKSINNCLTVYYKIINVRETRSTKKKFSGMMKMGEMNELKDIGRSMRIEKRNQRKRNSGVSINNEDEEKGSPSSQISKSSRKRKKASTASDKVKHSSESSHPIADSKSTTKTNILKRTSPRTLKNPPARFSDEQACETIYAEITKAFEKKESAKIAHQKKETQPQEESPANTPKMKRSSRNNKSTAGKKDQKTKDINETNTRATRAAKKQALGLLSKDAFSEKESLSAKQKGAIRNIDSSVDMRSDSDIKQELTDGTRRITRRMVASNKLLQDKEKESGKRKSDVMDCGTEDGEELSSGIRRAKRQALRSLRTRTTVDNEDSTKRSNSSNQEDEPKSDIDLWEYRFESLIKFKEERGHCLVPKVFPEDRQLSYWVFRQRGLYSNRKKKRVNNCLTDERIQRLQDIGFVFQAKHSKEQNEVDAARRKPHLDAKWNKFFDEFCKYKEETGSCLIPKVHEENQPLSSW